MISVDTRNLNIDPFITKSKIKLRAFNFEFIQDFGEAVVIGTGEGYGIKVVTGFLRGSWYAAIDGIPAGKGAADPGGGASVARLNLVAAQMTLGQTFVAVNGASYAGHVHNGTSRMRPRPWVTMILDRAPLIAEAAAARVAAR